MNYQINPPENSPAFDEWADAQQDKKDLIHQFSVMLGEPVLDYKHMVVICADMEARLNKFITIRDQLAILEDVFPADIILRVERV